MRAPHRALGLDLLRIAMAICVVALHTQWLWQVSPFWNRLTVDGIFRVAVPVFFIINGFYISDALTQGKVYDWLLRILRLYLFWAIVYLPAYFPTKARGSNFLAFGVNLLCGYWQLWYLVALAMGGTLLSALRELSSLSMIVLAALLFSCGVALQVVMLSGIYNIPVLLYRNFLFDAFPFLLIGFIIRRSGYQGRLSNLLVFLMLGMAGLATEIWLEYGLISAQSEPDLYLSLLLICPVVFLLAQKLPFGGSTDRWAKTASAIYFVHIGVMLAGKKLGFQFGLRLFFIVLALSVVASWPLVRLSRRYRFVL